MGRLLREHSGRVHASSAARPAAAPVSTAPHVLNAVVSSSLPNQERYVDASAGMMLCAPCPRSSQLLPSFALDSQCPVERDSPVTDGRSSPAAVLYCSQRPTRVRDCEQAAVRERHTAAAASPEGPLRNPSGSHMHSSSSVGISTKASMPLSKTSRQHRQVPSSSTHAVTPEACLAEQLHHHRLDRAGQRYPTPPWWLPGGIEADSDLLVRGSTHHFSRSMLQRRAGADDVTPHTGQAERGLGEEHRLPWPSTPAPPTLRSRARSAIKGCLPRPRSPSARLQATSTPR